MSYLFNLLNKVDHTCLKQTACWKDIKLLCDEGIKFKVATVCIPPTYVKQAKEYVENKVKICTVVGFPNGYNTSNTKVKEAEELVKLGADEIDMVINIGWLKDEKYNKIFNEIKNIKSVIEGKILKVIIETCLLDYKEKVKMCEIITKSGADFVKTSTGFSNGGATVDDIVLLKEHIGDNIKIKAAGGISSLKDAQKFLDLGVARLGSSKIVSLVDEVINK